MQPIDSEPVTSTTETTPPRSSAVRSWVAIGSAVAAFFGANHLWLLAFVKLGDFQFDVGSDGTLSTEFFAVLSSGMAIGLGAGWVVGHLVEGASPRDLGARLLEPVRGLARIILLASASVAIVLMAYLVFRGIAALPVSVAIIMAALIIASALRK